MNEPILLTVSQAAAYLGVSRWTVYRLLRDESIPRLNLRGWTRIPRAALDDWVAQSAS